MKFIFLYGSLMNPKELAYTLNTSVLKLHEKFKPRVAVLRGYRRIFNKMSQRWIVALNLMKTDSSYDEVWGIVIEVDENGFRRLSVEKNNII